jgi:hypothetical protein
MTEKDLERRLCEMLRNGIATGDMPSEFCIHNSTSDAKNLFDLIGSKDFDLIEDDNRWNLHPKFMVEIIGGMTPDVVLRSKTSNENRIYIEVKKTRPLGYGKVDSQIIRYLLHLLATTYSTPPGGADDIRRAILLAAPLSWFAVNTNHAAWTYFLETYSRLASCFGVTLGELHLPDTAEAV